MRLSITFCKAVRTGLFIGIKRWRGRLLYHSAFDREPERYSSSLTCFFKTWHDLRRAFATELRGRQVHEYDIADLLGHTIQSVTSTYARSTPQALEDAVNRLTEPRGAVIQFKRKVG